jgi:hypothetical protein
LIKGYAHVSAKGLAYLSYMLIKSQSVVLAFIEKLRKEVIKISLTMKVIVLGMEATFLNGCSDKTIISQLDKGSSNITYYTTESGHLGIWEYKDGHLYDYQIIDGQLYQRQVW